MTECSFKLAEIVYYNSVAYRIVGIGDCYLRVQAVHYPELMRTVPTSEVRGEHTIPPSWSEAAQVPGAGLQSL